MVFKKENIIEKLLLISALSSALIVFFIIAFMLREGIPALMLGWDFIFGMNWRPSHDQFGIFPIIVSTFIVGGGALAIAASIGIPTAIFLAELSPTWLRNILKPSVEMLVGIPSIILGFFGLMVFVVFIRDSLGGYGECILAGWIILAIMTLPHVVSISEDSIRAVPKGYKEASLALGATHLQTIKKVILPNARFGILASLILGMGNAVGETMAVLMVIGNPEIPWIPTSILEPVRVLTSTIVIEYSYVMWGSMHQHALFAIGVVLFLIVAILNLVTYVAIKGSLGTTTVMKGVIRE
ncbi:MAG: phosphate ABC transporter permease subunit PstC [Methanocellales archaeon]|nr:phosphate ABC transporter permease subunit PstC [Methanocellales archaeon]MDD3292402.1 phosphate ABC transporter permease subunit PstC [Methanocellales archaeon]MDD5235986.1 phosphate ABC transporter permease subunit PstC [Methanocellales archaeon]MDD5485293.1 phosphate ABC transporter permease subunit PstC [Methanocellales archaeon]